MIIVEATIKTNPEIIKPTISARDEKLAIIRRE